MGKKPFTLSILLILILIISCATKNQDNFGNSEKVVKIIATKAYEAGKDFEDFKKGKPKYNLNSDQTLKMDLSWSIKYLDKYNNILKLEEIRVDDQNNEEIWQTTINEYYSHEKQLLSKSTIKGEVFNFEKIYKRDNNGKLSEIIVNTKDKTYKRTLMSYNSIGQRIKEDVYEDSILIESSQYFYAANSTENDKEIKQVKTQFNPNSVTQTDFNWSASGKLLSNKINKYQNDTLIENSDFLYNNYIGNEATEILVDVKFSAYTDPFKKRIVKTFNKNNDIIKYQIFVNPKSLKDSFDKRNTGERVILTWDCNYSYNERNEWTKLMCSTENQIYIVLRDIQYLGSK